MLRAVAGGVAAPVALSRWFVLVISLRRGVRRRGQAPGRGRTGPHARARAAVGARVLHRRPAAADLVGSAASALFAYCVWAFQLPLIDGVPWRPLTIIPFATFTRALRALARRRRGRGARGAAPRAIAGCIAAWRGWWCSRSASMPPPDRPLRRRERQPPSPTLVRGWGGGDPVRVNLLRPGHQGAHRRGCRALAGAIARGMGRSYGDAAQLHQGFVIDTSALKGFELDRESGTVPPPLG